RAPDADALGVPPAGQDRPRRPVLIVYVRDPREKRDDGGDLVLREVRVWHQPPVALLGIVLGRIAEELPQVDCAAVLCDLRQIRRIVGTFAEQRVAVDAVLPFPTV